MRDAKARVADESPRTRSDLQFHVPPPPGEDSEDARLSVIETLMEGHKERAQARDRFHKKVRAAVDSWRAARNELAEPAVWKRLHDFAVQQRKDNYGLERCHDAIEDPATLANAVKEVREKSLALMGGEKIDMNRLAKIDGEHSGRLKRIFRARLADDGKLHLVPLPDVPEMVLLHDEHSVFTKTPPYDAWFVDGIVSESGWGSAEGHNQVGVEENPFTYITGQVGHFSRYENDEADNDDSFDAEFDTAVGFWYKPPVAGVKQIWIKLRFDKSRSHLTLKDELGWSNFNFGAGSNVTADVVGVIGGRVTKGIWGLAGGGVSPNAYQHIWNHVPPGDSEWVSLNVDLPPDWSLIRIGAWDLHFSWLDDTSCHQTMDTKIVVEEVSIAE